MKHANTKCDMASYKTIRMNGRVFPGLSLFMVEHDIDLGVTMVTVRMAIKKKSLKIDRSGVSFETISEPK